MTISECDFLNETKLPFGMAAPMTYLAHSANPRGQTDSVRHHLCAVAERAAAYAGVFQAREEAYFAGLLHDLGKYGDRFQRRLEGKEKGLDHWAHGAWSALTEGRSAASFLAIEGHHIGLQPFSPDRLRACDPAKLRDHHPLGLRLTEEDTALLHARFAADGLRAEPPPTPFVSLGAPRAAFMLDLRMLYSALVDADFVETAAHFNPDEPIREAPPLQAALALDALLTHLEALKRTSGGAPSVIALREDLRGACLQAAEKPPGLFTLTAPTGTGKTYAMLAFALRHAALHGLRRLVIVLPYLSIIEQTVRAYRQALPASLLPVLEVDSLAHTGSAFREDGEEEASHPQAPDWAAPLIVTTNVQLLESLFANRPGACRKLHNLAQSVVLFDEVQNLPLDLAIPTLATLSRLSERFGTSVVFSTATQPAFSHLSEAVRTLGGTDWRPQEIVPADLDLFARARRTRIVLPDANAAPLSWLELAAELALHPQALCILNLKRHAIALHAALRERGTPGLLHLSTNLCQAHRRLVLADVTRRLRAGEPCTLVATQCVEAGVDLDFPIVYRAWGPLDAIAQAAGRCNRNGLNGIRPVVVFTPLNEGFPDRSYDRAVAVAHILAAELGPDAFDLNDPSVFERYYRMLYDFSDPAKLNKPLTQALTARDFPAVAEHYKLIDQDVINILVPYDLPVYRDLRDDVFRHALSASWIQAARMHSVAVYRPKQGHAAWALLKPAPLKRGEMSDEWFVWLDEEGYDPVGGLRLPTGTDTECPIYIA